MTLHEDTRKDIDELSQHTMSVQFDFKGAKALVTGSGRGIGKEIVKQLVAANAKVIAVSKTKANLDELAKEFPTQVETICVDLGDWNATQKALEGRVDNVDYLVNNAAYAECMPIGQIDETTIDKQYAINVKAVVNITQLVSEGMRKRKRGSIVNISSVASLIGLANHLVYGGTKGAMDTMTKIMAVELGPHGVRVNSVNPTVTWTDMAMVGWHDPQKQQHMKAKIPLGRFVQPGEVAQSVLFFLSDAAAMLSGVIMPIDGGQAATSP